MPIWAVLLASAFATMGPAPALAEGFQPVRSKGDFLSLINGKSLRRFGINLQVRDDGQIEGRAMGWPVTGQWNWQEGYFCREMNWGGTDIGANCQLVVVQGRTLRFIADKGKGDSADLKLH